MSGVQPGPASGPDQAATEDPAADSFVDDSRGPRSGLALAGGLWALLTLPLVAVGWSWPWVDALAGTPAYLWLRDLAGGEPYVRFGALGGLSYLAIGLALLPDLRRAGWGGSILAWSVIAGGVVTALSYLGTPATSVLHPLWGAEAYLLAAIAVAGALAAGTAGRQWSVWSRVLMAGTLLVLVAGAAALGYYPHGCLVALGMAAAVLIRSAPRAAVR